MSKIILHNGKTVFWNGKTFLDFSNAVYSGIYLFDFGSDSYKTNGNWNNITLTSPSLTDIVDNSGYTSTINITVVSGFTSTVNPGLGGSGYPDTATRDYLADDTNNVYYNVSGLDDDKKYDFTFYSYVPTDPDDYTYIEIQDKFLKYQYNLGEGKIINISPINNDILIKLNYGESSGDVLLCVMVMNEKIPITYESTSIDSIQVVFETVPTEDNIGVTKTPFRYDKQYAYSYSWDDGVLDQYTYGFKYLTGGVAGDSNYYSGKTYTDGCGNDVNFSVGCAIFSLTNAGVDAHDGSASMSWEQMAEMYDAGWAINSHQFQDGATDSNYQVERNRSYARLYSSGYTTSTPSGITIKIFTQNATNYMAPTVWAITGMTKLYSYENANNYQWFGAGRNDHMAGIVDWDYMDGAWRIGFDKWPQNDFGVYRWNTVTESDMISNMNQATGATEDNKYHSWKFGLTHSVAGAGGGFGSFNEFMNTMDYLEDTYGSKGNDKLWMSANQNVYEYLYVHGVTDVETSLNNNIMDITISSQNTNSGNTIPDDLRTYALTLKITGATISDIIINGGTGCTYNTSYDTDTGLINLNWIGNENQPTNYDYGEYFVVIAESSGTTENKEVAQDYIWTLQSGSSGRTYLQDRLDLT